MNIVHLHFQWFKTCSLVVLHKVLWFSMVNCNFSDYVTFPHKSPKPSYLFFLHFGVLLTV